MAILKYKGSDGIFKPLTNILIKGVEVVQTSGTSSADVMSQNAVTEFVSDVNNTLTAHTSNAEIHFTQEEKLILDSISGSVGTMTYEDKTSYSSATEVNTALGNKANIASTLGGYGITDAYTKSETSGATEIANALDSKVNNATYTALNNVVTAHTANTNIHLTTTEKGQLHTHSNRAYLDSISGSVGTMAYEDKASYSSATEVNTALGNKANIATTLGGYGITDAYTKSETSGATEISNALNTKANTGHTHTSNEVTAMTNYTSGVTISPISTSDTLNTAIGKLEHSLGGIKLVALSQAEYDALTVKDPTTLYIVI